MVATMERPADLTRDTILRALEAHREELRRYGVKRIGLFGSFLHGTAGAGSDLDFLVAFERPSFDDYMDTKFLLEDLFGRKVDLVTEEALKKALAPLRDGAAFLEVV